MNLSALNFLKMERMQVLFILLFIIISAILMVNLVLIIL